MNVNTWIKQATEQLQEATISTARLDALLILGHSLKKDKAWLLTHPEHVLETNTLAVADQVLAARRTHQPLAYLFQEKEFYGRMFSIDNRVLVPRPETEALVELALILSDKKQLVADIGTGSGIIGITLALERPMWQLTLVDNDPGCLAMARENATHYAVAERLRFKQQDLLQNDKSPYDVIIANLPYVPTTYAARPDLQAEPGSALFSGPDGLSHYRQLFSQLQAHQQPPVTVITESLVEQQRSLTRIARQSGFHLQQTKDLAQLFQR